MPTASSAPPSQPIGGKAVWILAGIVTLVLAGSALWLGVAIMPPLTKAQTIGTTVPWVTTWVLILLTVLFGVVIAVNLFGVASGRRS